MLASLLEYCPPGEEKTAFFRAAFTMRLPPTIQAHLTGTELTDLKELAQLADRLWECSSCRAAVGRGDLFQRRWPPYKPSRSQGQWGS